jgi:hypothetical protein
MAVSAGRGAERGGKVIERRLIGRIDVNGPRVE